jgi:hypothetical protein
MIRLYCFWFKRFSSRVEKAKFVYENQAEILHASIIHIFITLFICLTFSFIWSDDRLLFYSLAIAVSLLFLITPFRLSSYIRFYSRLIEQANFDAINQEIQRQLYARMPSLYEREFAILGLPHTTKNMEVVKVAYRKLVQIHHPDKGGDEAKFIQIREAYEKIKKGMNK